MEARVGRYFMFPERPGTIYKITSMCQGSVFYRELERWTADQDYCGHFRNVGVDRFKDLEIVEVERPGGPIIRLADQLKEKMREKGKMDVVLDFIMSKHGYPVLILEGDRFGLSMPMKVSLNKKTGGRGCFWFKLTDGSITSALGRLNAKGTKVNLAGYKGVGMITCLGLGKAHLVKVLPVEDDWTVAELKELLYNPPRTAPPDPEPEGDEDNMPTEALLEIAEDLAEHHRASDNGMPEPE